MAANKKFIKYKASPGPLWPALAAAVGGGILQALSWPEVGLWPLCFICLVPLLIALRQQAGKRAFLAGWVYGLALSFASLPWLAEVLAGYGGLGLGLGWLILFLLAAILAIYYGLFAWLVSFLSPGWAGMVLGAIFWCGLDWLKNWAFTGFNWTPLAGPLALSPQFGQAGELLGFYGLGLVVALANFLTAEALVNFSRSFRAGWPQVGALAIILASGFAYGQIQYQKWEGLAVDSPHQTVAVIQPSVPQDQKWDQSFRDGILARYTALTKEARAAKPWLILWPETALPFVFSEDELETRWLYNLTREVEAPMLVGLAVVSGHWPSAEYRNRAWLFENGRPGHFYDKEHLVPFGEYLPLDWLPFLKWAFMQGLIGAAGAYSPGQPQPLLTVPGQSPDEKIRLGLMICFESTFPYIGRERILSGADLLVVTTNDGWFGHSWAPRQHLSQAVMRAIETRRPLVRAGNNGISAIINPSGRIVAQSELDAVGTYLFQTPLLEPAYRPLTPFVRRAYALPPLAAILTGLAVIVCFFKRRKK